ncbi:MAG: UDP-N-acetylmuramoyl-tripeptide--D-alanyl-D-alanine ligase [Acidobacteria bacterium]|nr:UDP-N-acetylmuramoyl-tripeptide--D-alanyl-D-alanine ligase [Acidobacteriota bacterium]
MARLSREEIVAATGGTEQGGSGGEGFRGFSIDSRTLARGDLFFALRGPNHDGHEFVSEAIGKGAAGVVIERPVVAEIPGAVPAFLVRDALAALQALAARVRERERITVVGVTGSAGKTTTKEMAFQVIGGGAPVYRSPGNLNNLYGLPLALLRAPENTRTAVLEMGMSRPGELRRLAAIARLDVACLTNILPVHLQFFDSVDAIAAAKGEIFEDLAAGATAVWNRDDPRTEAVTRRFPGRHLTFGLGAGADWSAAEIRDLGLEGTRFELRGPDGRAAVHLGAPGPHNLANALAAAAIGDALGVPIRRLAAGLERFRPLPMRGAVRILPSGVRVVDDSYNSNPAAMEQVLAWFAGVPAAGRRIVASGDMLELGEREERDAHRRIGERVARSGADLFVGVGPLHADAVEAARRAGLPACRHFAAAAEAAEFLRGEVRPGDLLLVKGSRGIGMERVIAALEAVERIGG